MPIETNTEGEIVWRPSNEDNAREDQYCADRESDHEILARYDERRKVEFHPRLEVQGADRRCVDCDRRLGDGEIFYCRYCREQRGLNNIASNAPGIRPAKFRR